jgi:rod shape-determining protein MreD
MWKYYLLMVFVLVSFIVLQVTVIPALPGFLRYLDLILALTIVVALSQGSLVGALFALFAGLMHDVATGLGLGVYTVPLFVLGYLVGQFRRVVFRDSIIVPLITGAAGAAAYYLLMTWFSGLFYAYWLAGRAWLSSFPVIFGNSLLVAILYAIFSRRPDARG